MDLRAMRRLARPARRRVPALRAGLPVVRTAAQAVLPRAERTLPDLPRSAGYAGDADHVHAAVALHVRRPAAGCLRHRLPLPALHTAVRGVVMAAFQKSYLIGTDILTCDPGVLSVCARIAGPPYPPPRGMLSGALEIGAALFLPTPLRAIIGGIGVLRVVRGIAGLVSRAG